MTQDISVQKSSVFLVYQSLFCLFLCPVAPKCNGLLKHHQVVAIESKGLLQINDK